MWRLCLLILVCGKQALAEDACRDFVPYPEEERRMHGYNGTITDIDDRYIDEHLYYGVAGYQVWSEPVPSGYKKCGTMYPVWMNDTPPVPGEQKTVKMCMQYFVNDCEESWKVDAFGCDDTIVFKLTRTPTARAGYCIGPTNPNSDPPTDIVTPLANVTYADEDYRSFFRFVCIFDEIVGKELFYQVFWYINNRNIFTSDILLFSNDFIQNTALTENILRENGFPSIGFDYRCSVRLRHERDGTPGPLFGKTSKFAGIKVLSLHIVVDEGSKVELQLQSTVEIRCGTEFPSDEDCTLNLEVENTDGNRKQTCTLQVKTEQCWVQIDKLTPNKVLKLNVSALGTNFYGDQTAWGKIRITTPNVTAMPFWSNAKIDAVTVEIHQAKSIAEGKQCHAVVDPHMLTFDKRKYEHQFPGRYTLYRHKHLPLEVQMETTPCNHHKAYCACSVAVRAGGTVYRIERCGPASDWRNHFVSCEDQEMLRVRSRGTRFEISMPIGTKVVVDVVSRCFLNVFIDPAGADVGNTEGLCGTLTNKCEDDFTLRDGVMVDSNPHAKYTCAKANAQKDGGAKFADFSNSWNVSAAEDLFNTSVIHNLKGWSNAGGGIYCSCVATTGGPAEREMECKATSKMDCSPGDKFKTIDPKRNCNVQSRRRRSLGVDNWGWTEDNANNLAKGLRHKRSDWENGWTELKARAYCEKLFNASNSIHLCRTVPGVDVESMIDNCVLDIQITGDVQFAPAAVESVKVRCLKEVQLNGTLQEADEENGTSIADEVMAATCPNECSHNGTCLNGECVCNEHYNGADCSVDVRIAPQNYGLDNEGHCDLQKENCTEASLYVDYIVNSDETTCKFGEFQVHEDGNIVKGEETINKANVITYSEAGCSLPTTRVMTETHVTRGVHVSVSNNGRAFSEESVLVMYDSACQMCQLALMKKIIAIQLSMSAACLFNGRCQYNGAVHPEDQCSYCQATLTSRQWVKSTASPCVQVPGESGEEEESNLWIIGAVVGSLGAVAVVAVTVLVIKKKRPSYISDSKTCLSPSLQDDIHKKTWDSGRGYN